MGSESALKGSRNSLDEFTTAGLDRSLAQESVEREEPRTQEHEVEQRLPQPASHFDGVYQIGEV